MKKTVRLFLAAVVLLLPLAAGAQARIGDYLFSSATYSFSSIASSGTQLAALETDDAAVAVQLPFTFQFGEDTCSQVMVSSNGQIGIGSANPAVQGYMDHLNDMSIIVPLGLDLYVYPGRGSVYYEEQGFGTNRSVVIEYNHVSPYGDSTETYTFQVVLYEGGDIDFIYDSCAPVQARTAYVFLREHSANSALAVAVPVSWASPAASRTLSPLAFSSSVHPAPGLTLSFERPVSNCPRPGSFICQSFARVDSVVFSWRSDPVVSEWELRYGPTGTPVDSMTEIVTGIYDTFYVCTTMVSGTAYDVYLRSDCGSEQSFWEGPVLVTPGAYNMAATGTASIHACGGIIYDDGGAAGSYSNNCHSVLTIYPSHTDSLVVVSGTLSTENCCDYLTIYDGASASGTALYEGRGTSQTIPSIRSTQGPLTLLFHSDGSVVYAGFQLNVSCVRAPLCRTISSVEISHVASASAYLSWSFAGTTAMPSYSVVTLVNNDDPTVQPLTVDVNDAAYFFSGLTPSTNYTAHVSTICQGDTVVGDSVSFYTRCPGSIMSAVSGTGTSQSSGVPVNSGWGNTFCQSIYTAAELTAMGLTAGPIGGMTFNWTNNSMAKEFSIYIGNTNVASFASTTAANWVPFTNQSLVYGPATHPVGTSGVVEYFFTAPFVWDGTSNIVVSTFVNQPSGASHSSSGFYAYSTSTSPDYRSLYKYQDGTALTPAAVSNAASSRSNYRTNVRFFSCDSTATCVAPNVILTRNEVDTVSIIWAPGLNETSWTVSYRAVADTEWTLAASGVTATAYNFTDLVPMTDYILRVAPDCGGDSVAAILSVTTPCVPIIDLPFTEDFEHFTASSTSGSPITNCWTRGTNYSYTAYPYLTTTAHSGSYSLYFYASGTSYYSYLALPALAASIDSLQVSFALRNTSSSYSLQVGVMTDPGDISTFTPVATVAPQAVNNWEMFEIPLTSYTGNGHYIAFAALGSTSYMYLDDVEVGYIPSCPRPRNVTVPSPSQYSAVVHWVDTVHENFEIEYGPSGFAHGTGSITVCSIDSVTLYSLRHSTRYDVYVRAICGAGDTSYWSFVTSFNTACGIIDSLPWSENFTSWGVGTAARPNCWACAGYSSYPYIVNVTDAQGVAIGSTFNMYTYSGNKTYFSLPELDSISYPIQTVQTVFKAWSNNFGSTSYSHDLVVGVCSVPGDFTSFTPVDTIVLTNTPTDYEVSFDANTGAGKYISFFSYIITNTSAYYNYAYIDSVAVEVIPACQRPNNLAAANVQTYSADLVWHDRSNATRWIVEYGPRGFALGTGTSFTTYNNPHTLSGLMPSSEYEFYVRAFCSGTDTSQWARTPGIFNTLQNPAPVPYFWDCEDSIEWANWQTNSNNHVNWYRGTAAGNGTPGFSNDTAAVYVSVDSGRTYSTDATSLIVNASCYRDFDFGTIDSSYILSFRAKAGGTVSQGYDGLMVFMVDPSIPVVASSANITSPWGDVRTLSPLVTVRVNPLWNTYNVVLDTLTGIHRFAFFWFNQATHSTTYPFTGGPAAIDDIRIQYADCPRPAGVTASNVTMSTADINWHGPSYGIYHVSYRSVTGGTTFVTDTVVGNSYRLTNLMPGSTYNIQIRRSCDSVTNSTYSTPLTFTTAICNGSYGDTIGNPNNSTTTYSLPTSNYYNYSYTQQIILGSELNGVGEISSIKLRYTGSSALTSKNNCTIYIGHTTLSSFSSADDFVAPDSMDMVFTGNLNSSNGWNEYFFNTPFAYNGTDNIVIAVDDNSGGYNNTDYTYAVDQTSAPMALCFYSDASNPDASSRATLSAFTGTKQILSYRNQMVLEICPPNTCAPAILKDPEIRPDHITLKWRHTGIQYLVSYRLNTTSSWLVDNDLVTDSFYVINNPRQEQEYVYRVRRYCDSSSLSNWEYGYLNSGDIPCMPPDSLHVTKLTNKKVTLKWKPQSNSQLSRLHVFNGVFDRTVSTGGRSYTIANLDPGVTYYASVRSNCVDIEDPSVWSDTIEFTMLVCPDATNLTYSDVRGNSVVLDWQDDGEHQAWEVQFGPWSFSQGTGHSVIAYEHPFTLTGLTGETGYDIYVRGICDTATDYHSEHWSNKVSIETSYSSVFSATDDARVRLFPNPTSGDVELTVPASAESLKVEVIDIAGRARLSLAAESGAERLMLPTSQLPQGSYFIRITGQKLNTVKKLIVK